MNYNLATLDRAERNKIEAHKMLCFIRHQARSGKITWGAAKLKVQRSPEPFRTIMLEMIDKKRR